MKSNFVQIILVDRPVKTEALPANESGELLDGTGGWLKISQAETIKMIDVFV